jgi:hypothetical protein
LPFLSGFVDNKGRALGFLLGDLFGLDGGSELRGEGEVLRVGGVSDGVLLAGLERGARNYLRLRKHRQA